jgi:hypothetical protein
MTEFDNLNVVSKEVNLRSIPFDEYFGKMDLTDEQKEERIELAEDFKDSLLFLFSLIGLYKQYADSQNWDMALYIETIAFQFKNRYKAVLEENKLLDEYVNSYLDLFAITVLEATMRHIDDEYYLSEDRATYIAENESNTILNHSDYEKAIADGKTKKKWIDIRDNRERKTHLAVGGTVKPIREPFIVGDSLMLYPKDKETYGASDEEICGCRCSIKYF